MTFASRCVGIGKFLAVFGLVLMAVAFYQLLQTDFGIREVATNLEFDLFTLVFCPSLCILGMLFWRYFKTRYVSLLKEWSTADKEIPQDTIRPET